MRKLRLSLLVTGLAIVAMAPEARAQNPNAPGAEQLRLQLEQRFAERVRTQLGLTPDQEAKVRAIMGSYAGRRRDLEQGEREMHQALAGQLRPGVAADADSVTVLVDRIAASRVRYATLMQEELGELSGVLTPVQRGQLFLMRDQLLMRAQELRQQRIRAGRPGAGPPPFDW